MKSFKPYLLSLLTLVSAAPMGAMQTQKQAQSGSVDQNGLINSIEKEVNAIAEEIANQLRRMRAGQAKEVNVIKANSRLEQHIALLPNSMKAFQLVLLKFLAKVNDFDKASSKTVLHAKLVNNVCKEIKVHIQKSRQIDALNAKIGEQLLDELAQALEADVIKIGTFDVHSKKVPGALKLTTGLKPFVARLTGDLAELREHLELYIKIATTFDNAEDTESMDFVARAVENLSESIALLREELKARDEILAPQGVGSIAQSEQVQNKEEQMYESEEFTLSLPVSASHNQTQVELQPTTLTVETKVELGENQEPVLKSALVKDGTPRKEKRMVTFADGLEIRLFDKEAAPSDQIQNRKEQILELSPSKTTQSVSTFKEVQKALLTSEEAQKALIATSTVLAPIAVSGLYAGYEAIGKTVENQLVTVGSNLSQLGMMPTFNFAASPGKAALWTTLAAGLGGAYYYFTQPAQSNNTGWWPWSQQARPQRPSGIIEELDNDDNVISSSEGSVLDNDGNVISSNDLSQAQPKKVKSKKNRPLITPKRMIAAAGISAGLAGLGYLAYHYWPQSTTPQIESTAAAIDAVSTPVMQEIMLPLNSMMIPAAPYGNRSVIFEAAMWPSVNLFMGQNVYQWLAGNSTSPWH